MAESLRPAVLRLTPRLAIAVVTLFSVQCGMWKQPDATPSQQGDQWRDDMRKGKRAMGEVTIVDHGGRFVWLRTPLSGAVPPETQLVIRSQVDGRVTAKLSTSPERKRLYVAADVTEGEPKVGDAVFFATSEKPLSIAPPALGALPGATEGTADDPSPPATPGPAGHLPFSMSDVPPPDAASPPSNLPPLGVPSGPQEDVPEFAPLPEPVDESQ